MRKKITISELGDVITGHTPPTSQRKYYGDYRLFVKPTDIDKKTRFTYITEEGYSEEAYKKYKNSLVRAGATCVVTLGSVGEKITMAHTECFTNQSINAVIPNEKFDDYYVFYLLKNSLQVVAAHNNGTASGRDHVSKTNFSNIEIEIEEDIEKQVKIGKILGTIDDLIENNKKQIELLEEEARLLYKRYFVDFEIVDRKSVEFVDDIPVGWKKVVLADICNLRKEVIKKEKIRNGVPYIGLEHIPRKDFCLSEWGDSSEVNSNKYQCYEDDILFGKIRPYFHKVGFALLDCISSTDAIVMQAKEGFWALLLMVTSSSSFVEYTYKTCKEGAKMPRADWNEMQNYQICIAPDNIQQEFEKYIWDITRKIKTLALQNQKLVEARDRLLPKLMNGEIEV